MKVLLITLLTLLGVSTAYADSYAAIAAGARGSSYVDGYPSMEGARNAAVSKCRSTWGTSCSSSIAEHSHWFFAAAICDGEPYTAASEISPKSAQLNVFAKGAADNRGHCRVFTVH